MLKINMKTNTNSAGYVQTSKGIIVSDPPLLISLKGSKPVNLCHINLSHRSTSRIAVVVVVVVAVVAAAGVVVVAVVAAANRGGGRKKSSIIVYSAPKPRFQTSNTLRKQLRRKQPWMSSIVTQLYLFYSNTRLFPSPNLPPQYAGFCPSSASLLVRLWDVEPVDELTKLLFALPGQRYLELAHCPEQSMQHAACAAVRNEVHRHTRRCCDARPASLKQAKSTRFAWVQKNGIASPELRLCTEAAETEPLGRTCCAAVLEPGAPLVVFASFFLAHAHSKGCGSVTKYNQVPLAADSGYDDRVRSSDRSLSLSLSLSLSCLHAAKSRSRPNLLRTRRRTGFFLSFCRA